MLFNCDQRGREGGLTPDVVNRQTGAYLHRMQWVADADIGSLPIEWNWLEGWNKSPRREHRRPCISRGAVPGSRTGRMSITATCGAPSAMRLRQGVLVRERTQAAQR